MSGQKQNTIQLLLTGKHPEYEKFAGKHVFVINNKIIPFSASKKAKEKIEKIKKKYKKLPTLLFVPKKEVNYIL